MSETSERSARLFGRTELAICVTVTLGAIMLHVVCLVHARALWRDETGLVQIATRSDLSLSWCLAHDSFPAFYFFLLRAWATIGLGGSDLALRFLGLLTGVALLGGLWINARLVGARWPVVALALLAANPNLLRWGDSLRAYGCGCLFILLTLGLTWRLVQAPSRLSFLPAALAAVLSVQTLYQNAFLVLAACSGGVAVCARLRRWRSAISVLLVGLIAGLSLVPYVPIIVETQDSFILQKAGFQAGLVWAHLTAALGSPQGWPSWVWLLLFLFVMVAGLAELRNRAKSASGGEPDIALFAATSLIVAVAGFYVFIRLAELPTEPWYFLPPMVFAAAAVEAAAASWRCRFRLWPSIFVLGIFSFMFPGALKLATYRQTNLDLIAAEVQTRARPGDFIVVLPWHCGITFARYYTGQIAWTTLPPLADHSCHRVDLLREQLMATSPIKPVLEQAKTTLKSGHNLWVVGGLPDPEPNETEAPDLPPAPIPGEAHGWWEGFYAYVWARQMAHLLAFHAKDIQRVPIETPDRVSSYENAPLFLGSGWHERQPNP